MGQVIALERMAVVDDNQLWNFLAEQPMEVAGELAYRGALRALADVSRFEKLDEATSRYTLAACRAALTAGALVHKPDEALHKAAKDLAKGTQPLRQYHNKLMAEAAPAADAMVRVISAIEAITAEDQDEAADLAGHAMAHDTGCYADCNLAAAEMPSTPIILPPAPEGMRDQLAASDAWAFWRAWHAEALRGTPLPWELQAEIARLPQDVWDAGPTVVAARIARIFARMELIHRIEALEKRMTAAPKRDVADEDDDAPESQAAAGFAAVRLIREPLDDILAQTQSPNPQPFLIQKAVSRLQTVLAASGKWLGRAAEGDIKEMVRMIGKGGGVATATWIDEQAPQIRAVIRAADDWRHRLPA